MRVETSQNILTKILFQVPISSKIKSEIQRHANLLFHDLHVNNVRQNLRGYGKTNLFYKVV